MNTRMRVKALPVLLASSLGLTSIVPISPAAARDRRALALMQDDAFPTIDLVVDESGVTGMPESLEAGRYKVNLTGPEPGEMGPSGFQIARLPEGVTPEQVLEDVQSDTSSEPSWYLDTYWGGGFPILNGTTAWGILDFTPGEWVVTTLRGSTLPVAFEVTGEFPADVAEPDANVVLDMFEMDFRVESGEFVAGENLVTIGNSGDQTHFVDMLKVPDGTTEEQVELLFKSFMTGTPEPDALQVDDSVMGVYIPEQSPGVSQTIQMNIEAGTYLFTCWVPDPETGAPHAMLGMHELVTIAE